MKSIAFGMTFIALTALAYTSVAPMAVSAAQAPSRVSQGVYTADQAKRGDSLYKEQCAQCHGDKLEGSGPMPALSGVDFVKNWAGKPVADLFEKTQTSMPATAPGSLSPQQTADILAYVFSVSSQPAGTTELPSAVEPLKAITFDAK
jgi:S-disulfanyl-L-cysteine oxidoreductase SoxD